MVLSTYYPTFGLYNLGIVYNQEMRSVYWLICSTKTHRFSDVSLVFA